MSYNGGDGVTRENLTKYNILIILGLFIVFYNPPLIAFNTMHIVGGLSIGYLILNYQDTIDHKYTGWIFYFALILLFLFTNSVVLHGNGLDSVVFPVYYLLDIIPFSMSVKTYSKKQGLVLDDVLIMCIIAGLIQTAISFLAFINSNIQDVFVSRIIEYGGIKSYSYWATLRMYGFSNGLMFEMPVIQSVLAVISIYFSTKKGWKYVLIAAFLFFSAIINARTSIIVVIYGIVIIVLLGKQAMNKKVKIIVGILLTLLAFYFIFLPYIQEVSPATYDWLKEGFIDIEALLKRDDTNKGYYSYISNDDRYVLPNSSIGLFMGEGISIVGGNNKYGVYSDIGFINDIWTGGLLYLVYTYSYMFIQLKKLNKKNNEFSLFSFIYFTGLILILNFKGRVFSMNSFLNLVVFLQPLILLLDERESYE